MLHSLLVKISSSYKSKAAMGNKLYIPEGGCLLAMDLFYSFA